MQGKITGYMERENCELCKEEGWHVATNGIK